MPTHRAPRAAIASDRMPPPQPTSTTRLPVEPAAHLLDPGKSQRIDLVQRAEHRALRIPPVMRERAELGELARVDVGVRRCGVRDAGRHCSLLLPVDGRDATIARLVDRRQSAVRDDAAPAHPHVGHGVAADGMDEMRHRIVAGHRVDAGEVDRDDVGLLARRRASPASARARARARRPASPRAGRLCAGSAAASCVGDLGEQRREPHFAEEVEPVVRRRAVGAERDVDAASR